MGEFAPVSALSGAAAPARLHPDPQAAVIAPVASSSGGRGAEARMDTAPNPPQSRGRGESEDAESRAPFGEGDRIDEFTLVGPSPAFQANVLEIEGDLKRTIERLEAERGRVEAEAAIRVEQVEARADAAGTDTARSGATPPAQEPDMPDTDAPKPPAGVGSGDMAQPRNDTAQTADAV